MINIKPSQGYHIIISKKGKREMTNQKMLQLSNEELVEMFKNAPKNEQGAILGLLYYKNTGLIKQIANKYTGYETIEDLMQESFFGLREAAESYDSTQGSLFSSYAGIWIRQAMRRYIESSGSCIRYPNYKRGEVYKYSKILNNFYVEFGRKPTDHEVSKILNITIEKVKKIKEDKARFKIMSLDAAIKTDDDGELTVGDTIAGEEDIETEIIEIQDNERLRLLLWHEVESLPDDETIVIKKRYEDNLSCGETGSALGIDESQVKSIQAKALRKLRKSKIINRIYKEEFMYSRAFTGTGLESFKRTQTSSTERVAIRIYEKECEKTVRRQQA